MRLPSRVLAGIAFVAVALISGLASGVVVALLIFYVASRYRVANANEALIVAGSRGSKVRDERVRAVLRPGSKLNAAGSYERIPNLAQIVTRFGPI